MGEATQTIGIVEKEGVAIGPFRRPRNLAASVRNSIHDDTVATKLGFRGGAVAGSIHMEQFPPLLTHVFGKQWFETGSLSTYFKHPTVEGEAVRAFVTLPSGQADEQVDVWMEDERGTLILQGTASAGFVEKPSMLQMKLHEQRHHGERRILADARAGTRCKGVSVSMEEAAIAPRLAAITEPSPWYEGISPWGGPIAHPGFVVHMARVVEPELFRAKGRVVGLFGAIEVRHHAGPVFTDRTYEASGEVLAVGDSPKSEYVWYESVLHEDGRRIASMIMMLRFMKASSPLWTD